MAFSFQARGYAFASTGNRCVRDGDTVWITPTGQHLRHTTVGSLAGIDMDGTPNNASKASKESPFQIGTHRAPDGRASELVHPRSKPLPVITPYYLMRVAPLAVVPYRRPGSENLAAAKTPTASSPLAVR